VEKATTATVPVSPALPPTFAIPRQSVPASARVLVAFASSSVSLVFGMLSTFIFVSGLANFLGAPTFVKTWLPMVFTIGLSAGITAWGAVLSARPLKTALSITTMILASLGLVLSIAGAWYVVAVFLDPLHP
jgi:hypothetical protein